MDQEITIQLQEKLIKVLVSSNYTNQVKILATYLVANIIRFSRFDLTFKVGYLQNKLGLSDKEYSKAQETLVTSDFVYTYRREILTEHWVILASPNFPSLYNKSKNIAFYRYDGYFCTVYDSNKLKYLSVREYQALSLSEAYKFYTNSPDKNFIDKVLGETAVE